MCGMIKQIDVFDHWVKCLDKNLEDYEGHIELARESTSRYPLWILKDIPLKNILTYSGSILEDTYFVKEKTEKYIKNFKSKDSVPAVVLVPLDRENKQLFLEFKYENKELLWEPIDGIHRLLMFSKLGITSIDSYVPYIGEEKHESC